MGAGWLATKLIHPISIPNIPFIKFNLVPFEEGSELILERDLPMMLGLVANVFCASPTADWLIEKAP